jgi:ankyrin repeat protein
MSYSQTATSRHPISSNAGAMAAGYAIESSHAFAADAICRRPLLRPASQEDGRRAAIRHFLNLHGQLLQAPPVPGTFSGLVEQAGQACTAVAGEGMRQAGVLVGRLAKLATAIDAGLRFPAATAAAPSCTVGTDGTRSCAPDGASRPEKRESTGTGGGVSFRFSAGASQTDVPASPGLRTEPGSSKQADALPHAAQGVHQTVVRSALVVRAYQGDLGQVDLLLKSGTNVNETDAQGNTALMAAALGMQEAVVRRLLEAGAGVDDVNREGLSALDMAVSTGNTEVTRMLLERSPQLDRINAVGYTPLYIAVQTDYPDLVRALLAAGADPNIAVSDPHPLSGLTPLMCAVLHKNHGIAGLLLQAGADVNHVTANGRDALLFAVQRNDPRMVNRLSRADAKPCSTPPGERSAFQEAVESGQHDMVEFMLRHAKTYPCPTPLLMDALKRAIYRGDLRMTSLLLEHGAPADQETQAAALGLAIKLGHDSIADLLRRHGDGERQPS